MESFSSRYEVGELEAKSKSFDMDLAGIRVMIEEVMVDASSYVSTSPEVVFYFKAGIVLAFIIAIFYVAFTMLFG